MSAQPIDDEYARLMAALMRLAMDNPRAFAKFEEFLCHAPREGSLEIIIRGGRLKSVRAEETVYES